MTDWQEAHDLLVRELTQAPALQGVSRVEIALPVDREEFAARLFIRTTPDLSDQIATAQEYQYPLRLLMNSQTIYKALQPHAEQGRLLFTGELMMAAMAGVTEDELRGSTIDRETQIFSVPHIQAEEVLAAKLFPGHSVKPWVDVLKYEGTARSRFRDAFPVRTTYVPDVPTKDLRYSDLERAVHIELGWYSTNIYPEDIFKRQVRLMRARLHHTKTIVAYT